VRSDASSAALNKIHAAEEHLKEQDDIAEQLHKLALEQLELEMKRKGEVLLLKAKKRDLDRQLKESDLRKKKSQLLASSAASSLVADVEHELGTGSCKSKVLSHKPKTANEAAEPYRSEAKCPEAMRSENSVQEEIQLKLITNLESMVLENFMPKLHVPKFDGIPSK
jgi:pyrroline-5-carboxylate reductase